MFAGDTLPLPCYLIPSNEKVCRVPEKINHFDFGIWVNTRHAVQGLLHVV